MQMLLYLALAQYANRRALSPDRYTLNYNSIGELEQRYQDSEQHWCTSIVVYCWGVGSGNLSVAKMSKETGNAF